jgi:hypothetical protein
MPEKRNASCFSRSGEGSTAHPLASRSFAFLLPRRVDGCISVAVFFVLSQGGFSPLAALLGFVGPFVVVRTGIQRARQLFIEQLMPLDNYAI